MPDQPQSPQDVLQRVLERNPRLIYVDPDESLRVEHLLYDADAAGFVTFEVYEPLFGGMIPQGTASRVEAGNYLPPFVEYVRARIESARNGHRVVFVRSLESLLSLSHEAPAALAGILEYLLDRRLTIVAPLRHDGPINAAAPYLFGHPATEPLMLPVLTHEEVESVLGRMGHVSDRRLVTEALTLPYHRLVALAGKELDSRLLPAIAEAKEELAREEGLIEIDTSRQGADLFGLDRLSSFFEAEVLPDLLEGRLEIEGILLLGPPGNGKTQSGAKFSDRLGKKLFKVRPTHSEFVGVSERRFRQALRSIERVAPAVALIDEIDREFLGSNSSADSGVTSRMFSELLQWLERNDRVFVVATSNATHPLDAAITRPGRLDPHFFVGPNPETRRGLLEKGRNEFGLQLSDAQIEDIATNAWGFSGARIWKIVKRARRDPEKALDFIRERVEIQRGYAEQEYRRYLPLRDVAEPASSQLDT